MAADELRRLSVDLAAAATQVRPRITAVITKTARDIEAGAKALAPVDTGALRNSIGADIEELSATIGPTVSYAIFVEGGTSRMGPQPFMGPATDRAEPGFYAALDQIADGLL